MTDYRIADGVAWVSSESLDLAGAPTAYVTTLPNGPAIVLGGTACVIWLALNRSGPGDGGSLDDIVERTLSLGGISLGDIERSQVAADTLATLDGLVAAGVATTIPAHM